MATTIDLEKDKALEQILADYTIAVMNWDGAVKLRREEQSGDESKITTGNKAVEMAYADVEGYKADALAHVVREYKLTDREAADALAALLEEAKEAGVHPGQHAALKAVVPDRRTKAGPVVE